MSDPSNLAIMAIPSAPIPVLIFSKTVGYHHECIPTAIKALETLGEETKLFTTRASEDAEAVLTPSSLQRYRVVILLHCLGNFATPEQIAALKGFLESGGGIVGIHGAAAGMPEDKWYGEMLGAHFDMHPDPEKGTVVAEEGNAEHEILCGCGGREGWMDEWYNFTSHPRENRKLEVLLRGDPKSFQGGKMGEDHPLAWCQEFGGGRVFYTALGHFDEAYKDEWFMGQVRRGILWAAGIEQGKKT
jgi:type 1 glutamine amidotransferase